MSPGLQCVRCPRRQVASPRGSEPRPGPAWRSTAHPCRSWGARHPSSLFPERLPVPGTVLGAETQPGLAHQESTFLVIPGPVLGTRTLPQASPKAFLPLEPPGHCRGGGRGEGCSEWWHLGLQGLHVHPARGPHAGISVQPSFPRCRQAAAGGQQETPTGDPGGARGSARPAFPTAEVSLASPRPRKHLCPFP